MVKRELCEEKEEICPNTEGNQGFQTTCFLKLQGNVVIMIKTTQGTAATKWLEVKEYGNERIVDVFDIGVFR